MASKNANAQRAYENALRVIDPWLEYKQYIRELPGMSVGIFHDGRMLFAQGYGFADSKRNTPTTASTSYRVASISKVFTAVAIIQLQEQQKLTITDPVSAYLNWFFSPGNPSTKKLTIKDLLSHTGGITRDGMTEHWNKDTFPTIEHIKQQVRDGGIQVLLPHTRFKYSNFGYAVLGELIHCVSGMTYEEYITKHIIEKLHLRHTVTSPASSQGTLATGYGRFIPRKRRETFRSADTKGFTAAAGVISNVKDLCTFFSALFPGDNRLLSEKSKKLMQKVVGRRKGEQFEYGLGLELWKEKEFRRSGHGGGFQGYTSYIQCDVKRRLVVVILTNAMDPVPRQLTLSIFHTLQAFEDRRFYASPSRTLQRYEGRYSDRWGKRDVVAMNASLLSYDPEALQPMKDIAELKPLRGHPHTFVIHGDSDFGNHGEHVMFIFGRAGTPIRMKWGPDYADAVSNNKRNPF
ncbi:MAG: beta-lactamase [Parcubacteria group bacterium Gr01-1014_38]|nr:MAG: beta-lactamase [Parcubacteria group bacterium Gr01-1014_38]